MDNVDKLLWSYLVRKGGVADSISEYGVSINVGVTQQVRELFNTSPDLVDWNKSTQVIQDDDWRFVGTYDPSERIQYLKGTLVVDNKEYLFYLAFDNMDVKDIIALVLQEVT